MASGGISSVAFGRLCVETVRSKELMARYPAVAFGRLCVETQVKKEDIHTEQASRLRAAVC